MNAAQVAVPAAMAAGAIALEFCAQPETWPVFTEYMRRRGVHELPREGGVVAAQLLLLLSEKLP